MRFHHWPSRKLKAIFFTLFTTFSLTGCQAVVVTPTLSTAQTPETTATPPGDRFWVDPGSDLGEISKFVLGANHGPWSDLGAGNIEPARTSGLTFLRWPGGNWGDQNDLRTDAIDSYILTARNILNAEPSITVRMPGSTPGQAAQIVQYTNINMQYGVKYWSIGNEPSLYSKTYPDWTPERYASEWRAFALAMKAVDPSILLVGPDIHQFVGDAEISPQEDQSRAYLIEFLKVNADLVDIVTVHRYPFPLDYKCQTCPYPSWADLRANTPEWDRILPNLRALIQATIGTDKPVGMTEFNSHTSNAAGSVTSPDSFYNALWLADVLGRLIRQRPEIIAYWMLKSRTAGHGLMSSFEIRPSYHVYQIYKQFGERLLAASSPEPFVSLFAARRADGAITLIFVNRGDQPSVRPLQLENGSVLEISAAYLFDSTHAAESIPPPDFTNGAEISLPAESVTLFILK